MAFKDRQRVETTIIFERDQIVKLRVGYALAKKGVRYAVAINANYWDIRYEAASALQTIYVYGLDVACDYLETDRIIFVYSCGPFQFDFESDPRARKLCAREQQVVFCENLQNPETDDRLSLVRELEERIVV